MQVAGLRLQVSEYRVLGTGQFSFTSTSLYAYHYIVAVKIIQEAITLVVFVVFALLYLREPMHWKYLLSFICLMGAVYFAFIK